MSDQITTVLHTDPACPWAYSEIPALTVIRWRYGAQLDWRLVTIGLTESAQQYIDRGYRPVRQARGNIAFRRYGMPFAPQPKARIAATARACRSLVATRLLEPGSEWRALRALQLAQFTTPLVLDDDVHLVNVVATATGHDAGVLLEMLDAPEVTAAYDRDRAEARSAAGSAAELQGKTSNTDGVERYTASSVLFERNGLALVAGGFQPVEAYDVLIANLNPAIDRRDVPEDPVELLDAFPEGLTTREVALLLTRSNDAPDPAAAELAMLDLVGEGRAARLGLGDSAIWALPEKIEWTRAVLAEALAPDQLEAQAV
jgi:protein-disulfide isomerase-like protein with CxxC motif